MPALPGALFATDPAPSKLAAGELYLAAVTRVSNAARVRTFSRPTCSVWAWWPVWAWWGISRRGLRRARPQSASPPRASGCTSGNKPPASSMRRRVLSGLEPSELPRAGPADVRRPALVRRTELQPRLVLGDVIGVHAPVVVPIEGADRGGVGRNLHRDAVAIGSHDDAARRRAQLMTRRGKASVRLSGPPASAGSPNSFRSWENSCRYCDFSSSKCRIAIARS